MEPYERSELGGVGEGVGAIDRAQPLTAATSDQRSQVSRPLPMGEPDHLDMVTSFNNSVTSVSNERLLTHSLRV
jgi:hypothetical protein